MSSSELFDFLFVVCLLLILPGICCVRRARSIRAYGIPVLCLVLLLTGCGAPASDQPSQSPDAYLRGALDWMQTHSVFSQRTNWTVVRREAMERARHAATTAGTYAAIVFTLEQLRDGNGFFLSSAMLTKTSDAGFRATYPGRLVVDVEPGSPAAHAGLRPGDIIETINGASPQRFEGLHSMDLNGGPRFRLVLRRPGLDHRLTLAFTAARASSDAQCREVPHGRTLRWDRHTVGYLDLPVDCGTASHAAIGQAVIRTEDQAGACGWILDLRTNDAGDIWAYLAAVGPILGDGQLGGFVYANGRRETWVYRHGDVMWNGVVRPESAIAGGVYHARRSMPPIAVLTDRFTTAAGELAVVALHGRPHTAFFGEPTQGFPTLTVDTPLSDGARLLLSGAFSFDRTGRVYRGPIMPSVREPTNWARLGTVQDPPVRAALRWLQGQSSCAVSARS